MLLAIGEELEHASKRSIGEKIKLSILFYLAVLPGNAARNFRPRTTRLPK